MASYRRELVALFLTLGLAAGAMAAPESPDGDITQNPAVIRAEPELQPVTEASDALPKAKLVAKARRVKEVRLPAPVTAEAQAKSQDDGKPGVPLQIGFSRAVPGFEDAATTVSLLEWEELAEGGQLGALSVNSPGAAALRLGLRVERMQPGAMLRFYGPGDEKLFEVSGQEILETIARNLAAGDDGPEARTYWSPVIETATIVMEIELPVGASRSGLKIAVPEISHLFTAASTEFEVPKAAAACEVDASCQVPTWGAQINAVARMVFTSGGGTYTCTGTLLADQVSTTNVPYFLSANHCIGTQSAASTLNTYWFFRSSACNSGVAGSYQSLAGGATLLYASANTDTAFMRLNSTPPGGAVYAGWAVNPVPAVGTTTTGLHHPRSDLLKISSGNIDGYWTCSAPSSGSFSCSSSSASAATYYANRWSSGITEPGSSGSGLFLSNGRYLIGQLYGGSSSCTSTSRDFYGRLDVAYNAGIRNWLSPATQTLTVSRAGAGVGTVTSAPAGINCGAACSATFTQGATVSLSAAPTTGSTFAGWSGACSGTATSCNVTMSAARSVTATFSRASITIAKAGNGTGIVTSSPAGLDCGTACSANFTSGASVTLTATPSAGSLFTGWSGACSGTSTCTLAVSSALNATATFIAAENALTITKSGPGIGTVSSSPDGLSCGAACSANFPYTATISLTATPAAGSYFWGWSGACTGTGACSVTMSSAWSVGAVFGTTPTPPPPPPPTVPSVTITRAGTGTGMVAATGMTCGATCSTTYPSGYRFTARAVPDAGSVFTGWSGACSGSSVVCTLTVTSALNVTANFSSVGSPPPPTTSYSLTTTRAGTGTGTVTSSPAGLSCGAACNASFASGTVVNLTAAPAAGSTFAGWTGACSGTGSCSVTMNAAASVGATFTAATTPPPPPPPPPAGPSVTITKTGTGTGTVAAAGGTCGAVCSQTYPSGYRVTMRAVPDAGSVFTGWSGGACSGTLVTCSFTVTTAHTVTANFRRP